ncbi:MAG: iron-sulfur cluster assembly accessory protein [Gammaproteobacteria bacterium]|nr:iron-sulfur cluster assembly accessory protein [Gammaproteobacteria bacterium]MBI5782842.1 iron-sulfur cluster assembly accessory protein [Gammaproteobacteria bacterium]
MIKITPEAAAQVRQSAEHGNAQNLSLRIAVRREEDGSFVYGMGFDDEGSDDAHFVSEGINVLVSNSSKDLITGATLDFVEINPGEHQFIFINPNDPAHAASPPADGQA